MVYVLTVIVAVIALSLVVLLSAQVELFRDMKQVRELTGMIDRPFPLDLGVMRGIHPLILACRPSPAQFLSCRISAVRVDRWPPHWTVQFRRICRSC